jgi:type III restriction enzyme
VDIFARTCPIRYIITVYALKEGWDCSYAYILCSLAEMGSSRAVEQILGRILRLPGAKRKTQGPLNWAYAFVASPKFLEAANSLKDALIENGFQKMEAIDFIKPFEQVPISIRGPLFEQVSRSPDFSKLPPTLEKTLTYEQNTGRLVLGGEFSFREKQALIKSYDLPEDKAAVERLYQAVQGARGETDPPLETKDPFQVPLMAVRFGDQMELFEESHFLDVPWNLAELNPSLSEEEFPSKKLSGATGQVDVDDEGMIAVQFVHQIQEQISWLTGEAGWTMAALANWIDRQIYHPDIPQAYSSLFIHKSIEDLIKKRGLTIEQLSREKFRLRNAVAAKIQEYRHAQHKKAYQQALFGSEALPVRVGPEMTLPLSEDAYSPNSYYEGSFKFQKHYFKYIGELRSEGEEFECAVFLDGLSQIKYWVRNLERRKDTSFWLQTATDRFYPDFLALLEDGRTLAVEYKGEHLWSNDDSKEKRAVGELWAEKSNGKCLFVMPKGTDWAGISSKIMLK